MEALKQIFFGSLWMLGIVTIWVTIYDTIRSELESKGNKGKSIKKGEDEK